MRARLRVLIVGSSGGSHIGDSLLRAAGNLGYEVRLCDTKHAWRHGTIVQKLLWHFGGRKPIALQRFSTTILEASTQFNPQIIITTGMAPMLAGAIRECRHTGTKCINFSTDDPFSPSHRAPWFLRALKEYDILFTPRLANTDELKAHGCADIRYLPFGYDPELFFPGDGVFSDESNELFFCGTAEPSRAEYVGAAVRAGIKVRLYGNYWGRYPEARTVTRGYADIPLLREEIASCKVALCLVRHENRDGHSMRTFEVPAVGACMVVEDTVDHRTIFGPEGERVLYFASPAEMVDKTQLLLREPKTRTRLRDAVHLHISLGHNTYEDRLRTMIDLSTGTNE